MTLSSRLWADNRDVAAQVLAHPFVTGVADGSLPREVFAGYVSQDAFFLESFARAYGLALDPSGNIVLSGLTSSANFPVVNPAQSWPGNSGHMNAFITKFGR